MPSTTPRVMETTGEKSLDHVISWKTDQLEEEQKKETAAKLRQSYAQWIAPVALNPDHLSGPQIAELLTPLSEWISKRAGAIMASQEEDGTTWLSASRAMNELISIFSTESPLTRIEIERHLSDWLKTSKIKTQYQGELGAPHTVTSPAQLLEQNDHIIWWKPTSATPKRSPWSEEETIWLEHSNIQMIDEHQWSLAIEQVALNTVMMAKKSLTIYHVTQSEGKSTHQPGILTRIEAYCGDKHHFHGPRKHHNRKVSSHAPFQANVDGGNLTRQIYFQLVKLNLFLRFPRSLTPHLYGCLITMRA